MSPPLAEPRHEKRRSPRRAKNKTTATPLQNATSNSESSPPRPASDISSSGPSSVVDTNLKGQPSSLKTKAQGQNKQYNGSRPNRPTPHMQTMSQTRISPDNKTTPSKQAYAGPTFHSSPAASSLPMPSFYSKSLPTGFASSVPGSTAQLDGQGHADSDTDTVIPPRLEDSAAQPKEPSPLDFMFEAARKARGTPYLQNPDHRSGRLSPFDDVSSNRSGPSRVTSSESVFPFELDGNAGPPLSIGPAFATPYKERMDALRSSKSQSITADERERREKSEALKRLLSNTSTLRSSNDVGTNHHYTPDQVLQARSADPNFQPCPEQQAPPTPQTGNQYISIPRQRFQQVDSVTHGSDLSAQPPVSSHLKREFQPDSFQAPAELDSDSGTTPLSSRSPQNFGRSVSGQNNTKLGGQTSHSYGSPTEQTGQPYSAQKLEDDLRRVLKLDPISSHGGPSK